MLLSAKPKIHRTCLNAGQDTNIFLQKFRKKLDFRKKSVFRIFVTFLCENQTDEYSSLIFSFYCVNRSEHGADGTDPEAAEDAGGSAQDLQPCEGGADGPGAEAQKDAPQGQGPDTEEPGRAGQQQLGDDVRCQFGQNC